MQWKDNKFQCFPMMQLCVTQVMIARDTDCMQVEKSLIDSEHCEKQRYQASKPPVYIVTVTSGCLQRLYGLVPDSAADGSTQC